MLFISGYFIPNGSYAKHVPHRLPGGIFVAKLCRGVFWSCLFGKVDVRQWRRGYLAWPWPMREKSRGRLGRAKQDRWVKRVKEEERERGKEGGEE